MAKVDISDIERAKLRYLLYVQIATRVIIDGSSVQIVVEEDKQVIKSEGTLKIHFDTKPWSFDLTLEDMEAPIPDAQLGDVAPDHIALGWTAWDQSGRSKSAVGVFQRRGRVMVALYGVDLESIKPLIPIVASRLAALSQTEASE